MGVVSVITLGSLHKTMPPSTYFSEILATGRPPHEIHSMATFREKLSKLRIDQPRELAEATGLDPRVCSDLMRRNRKPQADNAIEIARKLNVTVEWLFDGARGGEPERHYSEGTAVETIRAVADCLLELASRLEGLLPEAHSPETAAHLQQLLSNLRAKRQGSPPKSKRRNGSV